MRAIVVGAGLMGRWHAHAIQACGSTVAAVVDRDRARAAALGRRVRGNAAVVAGTLSEALAATDAGIVHVCTPLATHADLAHRALSAGCHVLVEKPFTDSVEAAEALLALAARKAVLACPVHQFLFQPGVLEANELLDSIGPLVHVQTAAFTAGANGAPESEWDAIALEIVPHPLALVGRLLGAPLSRAGWRVGHPAPGELRLAAVVDGVSVDLCVSLRGRPVRNELTLVGTRGTAHADLFHGFMTVERGPATRLHKVVRPFAVGSSMVRAAAGNLLGRAVRWEPAYPGLRELVMRVHAAARDGAAAPVTPDETLDVARARASVALALARPAGLRAAM